MRRATLGMAAITMIAGTAGRVDAAFQTFTSSANFTTALAAVGITPTIEGYESYPLNSLIPAGTTLNGVTYNTFPTGTSGRIDNIYNRIGNQSLALQRGTDNTAFFLPGDSMNISFARPINAIGIFFNANPTTSNLDLFINTSAGSATTGGPASNYDQSTLFFAGLISSTPFTSATIGSLVTGSSFNLDNLTFGAAVPEPSSIALTGISGLMGLGFAWRRRRAATS